MPLLSFSVKYAELNDGSKTQTIRLPRKKNQIKPGDKLYIWWKSRTKEREKLGEGICKSVVKKCFDNMTKEDAILDGFLDKECLGWTLGDLHMHDKVGTKTVFDIITWVWTYKENHDWRKGQTPKLTSYDKRVGSNDKVVKQQ